MNRAVTLKDLIVAMILVFFLAGAALLIIAGLNVENLRDGCERQNPRSQTLFLNTLRDAEARDAANLNQEIDDLADAGYRDAQSILDSVAKVSVSPGGDDNPELTEADAVGMETDCDRAYPSFP